MGLEIWRALERSAAAVSQRRNLLAPVAAVGRQRSVVAGLAQVALTARRTTVPCSLEASYVITGALHVASPAHALIRYPPDFRSGFHATMV